MKICYPSFPGNLKRIRKEKRLTFRMLSLICEATSSNLCRYEQGIHMPRTRTLQSISRALGVPVNELLGPLKINGEIAGERSTSEPVAYITGFYRGHCVIQPTDPAVVLPVGMALYRAPTDWVGLTDEEIAQLMFKCDVIVTGPTQFDFARAIEAKLKEKHT